MPKARLKVQPTHDKLASFTTKYPDVEFEMLAVYPAESGIKVLLNAPIDDTQSLVQHLEETPEVSQYDMLHKDEQGILVQYVVPKPNPHQAALLAGNLPNYPLIVRDGWIFSEITTSQERLSSFKDELENAGVRHEILSVNESREPAAILTDRQAQLVTEALNRGYYDSPRQCSLTDLATVIGVDKSTASGILHRAEGRIIEEFFSESSVSV